MLRLITDGLLGDKAVKQSLEISDFNHFALSLGILDHRVELHHILSYGLPLPIKLLLGHLDLYWAGLLRKLVMHNVGDVARVWHLGIVLLLLVYVVVLLKKLLQALTCSDVILLKAQDLKSLSLSHESSLDS